MEEEAGTNSDNTGGSETALVVAVNSTGGSEAAVEQHGGGSEDSGQDSDGTGDKQEAQGPESEAHRCRQLKARLSDGENRSHTPSGWLELGKKSSMDPSPGSSSSAPTQGSNCERKLRKL